jgi:carboxypeptidase Taq
MDKKDELKRRIEEIANYRYISALLSWDQETGMPVSGASGRGAQLAIIETKVHSLLTDPGFKSLAQECLNQEADPVQKKICSVLLRDIAKNSLLPETLVNEFSIVSSQAFAAWIEAKKNNDFSLYAPWLDKLRGLACQKAACYGPGEPYTRLMDDYEIGLTQGKVSSLLESLVPVLSALSSDLAGKKQDTSVLRLDYPVEAQKAFCKMILSEIGYEWERGRMDESMHPFSTKTGADDIRVTAHYYRNFFPSGLFSILHEGGHALYEMGTSEGIKGTWVDEGTSLGIHESQSRWWENIVGRSFWFWHDVWDDFVKFFPSVSVSSPEAFYRAVNASSPSLIRIEADEVTYNLHIAVRFEIEKALIGSDLNVLEVPALWNRLMKDYLGVTVKKDSEGCLQDVHWCHGSFGYFPTYMLGNLYSAQFAAAMEKSHPLEGPRKSRFMAIRDWQRKNIHQFGRIKEPDQLCNEVCGSSLDSGFFIRYLKQKYRDFL